MTLIHTFITLMRNGIPLLREAHAIPKEELELILRPDHAAQLHTLAHTYLGPSIYAAAQRRATAHAERQQHSWQDLLTIEKYAQRLSTHKLKWKLREHLCNTPSHNIPTAARTKLRELTTPHTPRPGIHIRRRTGTNPDTLTYTGPSAIITQLYDTLNTPNPDQAAYNLLHNTLKHTARNLLATTPSSSNPTTNSRTTAHSSTGSNSTTAHPNT